MAGQVIEFGMSIYQENPSIFFVLISTVIILVFALLMSNNIRRSEMRVVFVVIPIALATYSLSINLENIEHDFFQNLSTEFIGGLLALMLFAEWVTSNEYTFPIVALAIFGAAAVFIWQASLTNDGFYTNLSTELLGALITTAVVRREWLWQSTKSDETHAEKHLRFESRRRNIERETAKRMCQMQIVINGQDREDIDSKQNILLETVEIMFEDKDSRLLAGGLQRTLYANCRPLQASTNDKEHLIVIFDGHEDAISKTLPRFQETFDVQEVDQQATHLKIGRAQFRTQIKTPDQSFEQELHDMIDMFTTRWRNSLPSTDSPTNDYEQGYDEAIEYVCKDLRTMLESI